MAASGNRGVGFARETCVLSLREDSSVCDRRERRCRSASTWYTVSLVPIEKVAEIAHFVRERLRSHCRAATLPARNLPSLCMVVLVKLGTALFRGDAILSTCIIGLMRLRTRLKSDCYTEDDDAFFIGFLIVIHRSMRSHHSRPSPLHSPSPHQLDSHHQHKHSPAHSQSPSRTDQPHLSFQS